MLSASKQVLTGRRVSVWLMICEINQIDKDTPGLRVAGYKEQASGEGGV